MFRTKKMYEFPKRYFLASFAFLFPVKLFAGREYSGRGVDMYDPEDFVSLKELIATYPDKLKFLPVALVAFLLAFLTCSKRESVQMGESWYRIHEDDKTWQKVLLVICWIAFVIGLFPTVWTSIDIIWRVIVGSSLTVITWLFQILISIIVLVVFVGLIPMIAYANLEDKNKTFSIVLSLILLLGTVTTVAYYWEDIMGWPFMFPALEFNL